jgi:hypothetical protein
MGLLTPLHVDGLLDAIGALLDEIRPDVVALTDAFGFDDYNLKVGEGGRGWVHYMHEYKKRRTRRVISSHPLLLSPPTPPTPLASRRWVDSTVMCTRRSTRTPRITTPSTGATGPWSGGTR